MASEAGASYVHPIAELWRASLARLARLILSEDPMVEHAVAPATPGVAPPRSGVRPGGAEFIALIASLMALNALSIDIMLPALLEIGDALGVENENDSQLVVFSYLAGFGLAQLAFGPLTDRYGRRFVLAISLAGYAVMAFFCLLAPTFETLLAARALQGVAAAGSRVISVSIVRDVVSGRAMARIMSIAVMVFMAAPVLAPAMGQAVLAFAPWRWLFVVLMCAGVATVTWVWLRLPETLPAERRCPIDIKTILRNYGEVFRSRIALGYTVASAAIYGGLFAYVGSAEQVFVQSFQSGTKFALFFAVSALGMALSAFLNSKLVERYGMRRISHGALCAMLLVTVFHFLIVQFAGPSVGLFVAMCTLQFFAFGLIGPNFNALAMEPLGRVAGSASAAYGFATTTFSAGLGAIVGRAYDGTIGPLLTGFVVFSAASLVAVLLTERGQLFNSR